MISFERRRQGSHCLLQSCCLFLHTTCTATHSHHHQPLQWAAQSVNRCMFFVRAWSARRTDILYHRETVYITQDVFLVRGREVSAWPYSSRILHLPYICLRASQYSTNDAKFNLSKRSVSVPGIRLRLETVQDYGKVQMTIAHTCVRHPPHRGRMHHGCATPDEMAAHL